MIRDLSNTMIDQIKVLIHKSFPEAFDLQTSYFVGKEEDTDRIMLVFNIKSKKMGIIYQKMARMQYETEVDDREPDFVGKILSDFIVIGTTFLINNVMNMKDAMIEDADAILTHPFTKADLRRINLN